MKKRFTCILAAGMLLPLAGGAAAQGYGQQDYGSYQGFEPGYGESMPGWKPYAQGSAPTSEMPPPPSVADSSGLGDMHAAPAYGQGYDAGSGFGYMDGGGMPPAPSGWDMSMPMSNDGVGVWQDRMGQMPGEMQMPLLGPQAPGGMGRVWRLDLSDEQRKQIRAVQLELWKKNHRARCQMTENSIRLLELQMEDRRDAKAIGEVYAKVFELQRQMIEASIEAGNRIQELLTEQQRARLKGRYVPPAARMDTQSMGQPMPMGDRQRQTARMPMHRPAQPMAPPPSQTAVPSPRTEAGETAQAGPSGQTTTAADSQ
jgi:hypothetical protein